MEIDEEDDVLIEQNKQKSCYTYYCYCYYEEEENLAADEAVVDGVLFRDNIANEMLNQYVAYCLANA